MASNLRARPIEGYITDSAGNVQRNAEVIIKEETPTGSNLITSVKADDDGYFITNPIKNGVYDIYESGVRVSRLYHSANPTVIQSYSTVTENIPTGIPTFEALRADPANYDINDFRHYIQVEPSNMDVATYGHMFPIWDVDPTGNELTGHPFEKFVQVHTGLSSDSRFSHTRFDVEYFNPITSKNTSHRRIRWAGIPAVRFYEDTKLVLPLDYYSVVPNHPYKIPTIGTSYAWSKYATDTTDETIEITFTAVSDYQEMGLGDIIYLEFYSSALADTAPEKFWAIVIDKDTASPFNVLAKMWKSSNSSHAIQGITNLNDINSGAGTAGGNYGITGIHVYQAIFSNISNITQSTGEQFTVLENTYAQNLRMQFNSSGVKTVEPEMYNYNVIPNPNT